MPLEAMRLFLAPIAMFPADTSVIDAPVTLVLTDPAADRTHGADSVLWMRDIIALTGVQFESGRGLEPGA